MTGTLASAIILSARSTGAMVDQRSQVRLELTVFPVTGDPYAATVTQLVSPADVAKAVEGRQVKVRVDPADPAHVWIDWAGS